MRERHPIDSSGLPLERRVDLLDMWLGQLWDEVWWHQLPWYRRAWYRMHGFQSPIANFYERGERRD